MASITAVSDTSRMMISQSPSPSVVAVAGLLVQAAGSSAARALLAIDSAWRLDLRAARSVRRRWWRSQSSTSAGVAGALVPQ